MPESCGLLLVRQSGGKRKKTNQKVDWKKINRKKISGHCRVAGKGEHHWKIFGEQL